MCDAGHGAPLIPWPNRLEDGRYRFDGRAYQLALSEPERRNAIHGLLRWRPWQVVSHGADRVTMGTCLFPTPGYPFSLKVQIEYRLGANGLTVTMRAWNVGESDLPYACGQHLYLSAGGGYIDDCELRFAAGTRILADPERQLPVGQEPVVDSAYDFGAARRIGKTRIDFAFGDLERDEEGRARACLTGVDGRQVELWAGRAFGYLQVYTGDGLESDRRRMSLAVEPMTCPPNGLKTGEQIVRLHPGESWEGCWGVRVV
jgi:aldose 1-epimerase